MRISDWSSDVCSSDLLVELAQPRDRPVDDRDFGPQPRRHFRRMGADHAAADHHDARGLNAGNAAEQKAAAARMALQRLARRLHRSEEHTSELQSLMRISYAVFCLKKKNNNIKLYLSLYP